MIEGVKSRPLNKARVDEAGLVPSLSLMDQDIRRARGTHARRSDTVTAGGINDQSFKHHFH